MSKMIKCPCCGKEFDSRGFKVHVIFCCGSKGLKGIVNFLIKNK